MTVFSHSVSERSPVRTLAVKLEIQPDLNVDHLVHWVTFPHHSLLSRIVFLMSLMLLSTVVNLNMYHGMVCFSVLKREQ